MNKQIDNKAIEEMAKIICQECLTATEEENCQHKVKDCMAYEYAKLFYNSGYKQPINDDEVVISKEEYEQLKKFEYKVRCGVCFTQKEWFDYINEDSNERTSLLIEAKAQTRKETAREILQEFSNELIKEFLKSAEIQDFVHIKKTLRDICPVKVNKIKKKLAKKHGVEVE